MLEVMLTPGRTGVRLACLRELCGRDEAIVRGTSSAAATDLLARLLVEVHGAAVTPADLTVCDRDRLLAAVHRATFGDHIDTRAPCSACAVPFDLAFSLAALEADLDARAAATLWDAEGVRRLADGRRFRLPTLADEQAIAGLAPDLAARTLAARCLLDGELGELEDPSVVLAAVEHAGPILDLELSATCPACQAEQSVHFDIQTFLLTALLRDGPGLAREIHRIAVAYGWSLAEILDLPRTQRRIHVELIDAERTTRRPYA